MRVWNYICHALCFGRSCPDVAGRWNARETKAGPFRRVGGVSLRDPSRMSFVVVLYCLCRLSSGAAILAQYVDVIALRQVRP